MKIEQLDSNRIKVVVDSGDQREFGVTYESMNYSDANTRRLCEKIMSMARTQVGFSVGNAKLLVEARKSGNGSVTLYLSRIPAGEKEQLFGQMLVFFCLNDLLDSRFLFENYPDDIEIDVFSYNDKYYLYFEIITTQKKAEKFLCDLLEYAERSKVDRTLLCEYGERIKGF